MTAFNEAKTATTNTTVAADPQYLLFHGDCVQTMRSMASASIDSIVSDPPYGLKYQGKQFDDLGDGAQQREWHRAWAEEAFRVLKPGGWILAFSGTRTYHHLAAGLEEAGFEVRDMLNWVYAQGMTMVPATTLKPAHEPIVVARKPLEGTIAQNVATYGTGTLQNQRVLVGPSTSMAGGKGQGGAVSSTKPELTVRMASNMLFSHSPECVRTTEVVKVPGKAASSTATRSSSTSTKCRKGQGATTSTGRKNAPQTVTVEHWQCADGCPCLALNVAEQPLVSTNSTQPGRARYFQSFAAAPAELPIQDILDGQEDLHLFCPKPLKAEYEAGLEHLPVQRYCQATGTRGGGSETSCFGREQDRRNVHPTIKPIELMRWLCRLVTPEGGTVMDPFLGSGSTGCAVAVENSDPAHSPGWRFIGVEADFEDDGFLDIAEGRIRHFAGGGDEAVERREAAS